MAHGFIDCQALGGGGVTLGAVKEGFVVARRLALPGGFGNACVDANTHLFGDGFEIETGEASDWEPVRGAAYLNGTPPCSGFSGINTSDAANARGMSSPINRCQRKLVEYASRCTGEDGRRGPEIVAFESVRQAYVDGRQLMTEYARLLRELTGERYVLYHLLHSDASLNGCQARPRYFWCAARVPFRVFVPPQREPPTYRDVIGDLEGLEHAWGSVLRRVEQPSEWVLRWGLRDTALVTAHQWVESEHWRGMHVPVARRGWNQGEKARVALQRFRDETGSLPPGAEAQLTRFSAARRVRADKRGLHVLTGGCATEFIHYAEPRGFTVRELARMMGLPDSFSFSWASSVQKAGSVLGKNCTLVAGRWVAALARAALDGAEPDGWEELRPTRDGEDERVVDVTHRWKSAVPELEEVAA